jgi:hypothetical protein
MHRQSSILPVLNNRCRFAATAAAPKVPTFLYRSSLKVTVKFQPRPIDEPQTSSKWARPHIPLSKLPHARPSDTSNSWIRSQYPSDSVASGSNAFPQTNWARSTEKQSDKALRSANTSEECYSQNLTNEKPYPQVQSNTSTPSLLAIDVHPPNSNLNKWARPTPKQMAPPAPQPSSTTFKALLQRQNNVETPASPRSNHWARVLEKSKNPPPNKWSRMKDTLGHPSDVTSRSQFDKNIPPHKETLDRVSSPSRPGNNTAHRPQLDAARTRTRRDPLPHSPFRDREVPPHHNDIESDRKTIRDLDISPLDQPLSSEMRTDSRRGDSGKAHRESFKTRGSIVSRLHEDVAIPGHSKFGSATRGKELAFRVKNIKPKQLKRTADVFIPTTVSVGQLARLLNVKLGASP